MVSTKRGRIIRTTQAPFAKMPADPQAPIQRRKAGAFGHRPRTRLPLTIEGELVAKSTGTISEFSIGDRVFHQKFGNGNITAIDGNKLVVEFDKAGEKRVVDSYVERS